MFGATIVRFLIVTAILFTAMPVWADDPFAPAGGGADPFGGGSTPTDLPTADEPSRFSREDPVVLAILEGTPTDVDQPKIKLMRGAKLMFDYRRFDIAERYFSTLIATAPTVEDLTEFRNTYGTTFFLRVLQSRDMSDEAKAFADSVLTEADKASRDPKRIEALIGQLSDPAVGVRSVALRELNKIGSPAIARMLAVLANDTRPAEHKAIQAALIEIGHTAIEPVMGALESGSDPLVAKAIYMLGYLNARDASPLLVGIMYSPNSSQLLRDEAAEALERIVGTTPTRRAAILYLRDRIYENLQTLDPDSVTERTPVIRWTWNPKVNAPIELTFSLKDKKRIRAAQLATYLYAIDPDDLGHRRLYLASLFQSAVILNGVGRPLPRGAGSVIDRTKSFSVSQLNDALAASIEKNQPLAAIGLATAIGARGDKTALSASGSKSPLAQALQSGDQRLRFTAAAAIMEIDPQRPYVLASEFADVLSAAIEADSIDRAVIAMPRLGKAQDLAALLSDTSLLGEAATTGKEAFRLAATQSNVQVLLVSHRIDKPPITRLISELRQDSRTAQLPIGIMYDSESRLEVEALADLFPGVTAFPTPQSRAFLDMQARRLIDLKGRNYTPGNERVAQAKFATAYALKMLTDRKTYSFYDLHALEKPLVTALHNLEVAETAAAALGKLGTPSAQRELVNLGSGYGPLALRKAAVSAFGDAVANYGLLLESRDIQLQYERYNESESQPKSSQQVLGGILDAMEAPLKSKGPSE